jgi:hypothetical protein
MNLEEARILLNDYLDGELSPQQRDELERCLAASPELRRELAALRSLLARARGLPDDLVPGRDLWPVIAERLAGDRPVRQTAPGPMRHPADARSGSVNSRLRWLAESVIGSFGARRPIFAAAAVTVVVLLAVVAVWQIAGPGPSDESNLASGETSPAVLAVLSDLDAECAQSALETATYAGGENDAGRSPILELISHNLRIIDLAIADAREAWQADPQSPQLMRLLTSAYRAKAALQRQETRLAAQL